MALIIPEHKLMFVMVPGTGCSAVGQVIQKRFDAEWFPPEDLFENNKKIPRKHISLQEIIRYGLITREELSKYLIFATVRNPFDRVTTLYQRLIGDWSGRRLEKHKGNLESNEISKSEEDTLEKIVENREKSIETAKQLGFDDWLEKNLNNQIRAQKNKNKRNNKPNKMTSLLELLVDPDKMQVLYPLVQGCDRVIRFESLEADLNKLLKEAGIISNNEWIDIPKNNPTQGKKRYQEYYSDRSRLFMEQNFSKELRVFGYKFEE